MFATGLRVENIRSELIDVAGRKAISVRCDVRFPGVPERVSQWQVAVPAGRKSYIVTCSALQPDFARVEPLFKASINSMEVKGGLFGSGSRAVLWAVVAGIVGGIVGLGIWISRKIRASAAPANTSFDYPEA